MDIAVRWINVLVMVALPLVLGVILARRTKVAWRLFLVGGATFVGSQIPHIPFNSALLTPFLLDLGFTPDGGILPRLGVALAYGLSAGVFEESARFLVYRLWLREERSWREALMFGLGHGGIEAIILGALAGYGVIQAVAYRNADLSTLVPPERVTEVSAQLTTYWNLPWYGVLLGAVERSFTLVIHVSLTVLMLQAFLRRQWRWAIVALLWHTFVDAAALFVVATWGEYAAEGAVAMTALVSLVIIWMLRDAGHERDRKYLDPLPELPRRVSPVFQSDSSDVSVERVEDSRFV